VFLIRLFICDVHQAILSHSIKTYEELTAAGVPCTVVLDSAVAYVMEKVDFVLVGSEAVVESGGLINAVGSNQIAIIAKAANKPFYALAERSVLLFLLNGRYKTFSSSYKFHRLFPLSQYDLPTHTPDILSFSHSVKPAPSNSAGEERKEGSLSTTTLTMTTEQISQNPSVDYTR